ncbi:hypothetical protein ENUP19_0130G0015 [Entamoeba nuttalli]|uniref:Piwi domain containing protein n=2 Tax=Entamoeba nuttalli TaxID=412467 RepID=K2H7X9_ENTNP|nr:piwi domain containing protein [Entamoeba nuttalli P19]EKE38619.1 piwi domain containing protein [Entamoeba nuttalli P19]|eukprot:XP_008859045.1 piwi domain containing protein [Entamoeba nuttalli P19]
MKQVGVLRDFCSEYSPSLSVDLCWDDPYPKEFTDLIPQYEDVDDSDSFEVTTLFHKISNDSSNYYSYQFSFQPELQSYQEARNIIFDYFRGKLFYVYHNNIYLNEPIEEEAEVDVDDISFTITFTPVKSSLDVFRAADIIKSSLYRTSEYQYQKKHIFCYKLKTSENNNIHQSFDVYVNGMKDNFYVHFPVTDRKVIEQNYLEESKEYSYDEISIKFRPSWYYNEVSKQLEWIDEVKMNVTPDSQKFFWGDQEVSVSQYYTQRYGGAVHFDPNQFLMVQKQRKFGRIEYAYYVPQLMHRVIRVKQLQPLQETLEVVSKALKTIKESPVAEAWGLSIEDDVLCCKAHLCHKTKLLTSQGSFEADENWEFIDSFIKVVPLTNWFVYCKSSLVPKVKQIISLMITKFKQLGVTCREPKIVSQSSRESPKKTFSSILNSHPQIVFSVFDSIEQMVEIKEYFMIYGNIPTQIIDLNERYDDKKITNLCLRTGIKLGCSRLKLDQNTSDICVIGITSREFFVNKTLITLCISKDENLNVFDTESYFVSNDNWHSGFGLEQILKPKLEGRKLKRIFVYRCGISDNLMKAIRFGEVEQFLKICKQSCGEEIKVCFITTDNISSAIAIEENGELKSTKEGTFVISPLVNKNVKGFILNAKPEICKTLKYVVLYDNTGLTLREIIQFTFDNCHLSQGKMSTGKLPYCANEAKHFQKRLYSSKILEEQMN